MVYGGVYATEIQGERDGFEDAIFVENDALSVTSSERNDGLFGVEDEALSGGSEALDGDTIDSAADAILDPQEASVSVAVEDSGDDLLNVFWAIDESISLLDDISLTTTAASGQFDALSLELVSTLHAANGPPVYGDLLDQQATTELTISGSEFTSGSGFDVYGAHSSQNALLESLSTHIREGDFLFVQNKAPSSGDVVALSENELEATLAAVVQDWSNQAGAADVAERLEGLEVLITDLPDGIVGEARGTTILIDATAAGYGWFVDATPDDSTEFETTLDAGHLITGSSSEAFGRIDLVTVLSHEIGHVLGYDHDSGLAVMSEVITSGERKLISGISDIFVNHESINAAVFADAGTTVDLSSATAIDANAGITVTILADGTATVSGGNGCRRQRPIRSYCYHHHRQPAAEDYHHRSGPGHGMGHHRIECWDDNRLGNRY